MINQILSYKLNSSSTTSSFDTFEQLNPLQSPQAETQLRLLAQQEQEVFWHGFLDVSLQLHLMMFSSSFGAISYIKH